MCCRNWGTERNGLLVSLDMVDYPQSTSLSIHNFPNRNEKDDDLHTSRTPRHLPPLPHAVDFPRAVCVRLALHVVVIERCAAGSDEEACAHEGGGGCADFFHGGDFGGEGGAV